jgi:hypothetical protein
MIRRGSSLYVKPVKVCKTSKNQTCYVHTTTHKKRRSKSISRPRKLTSRPRKSIKRRSKSISRPRKLTSRPKKSIRRRSKSTSRPRKLTSRPKKSTSRPRKSTSRPKKSIKRRSNEKTSKNYIVNIFKLDSKLTEVIKHPITNKESLLKLIAYLLVFALALCTFIKVASQKYESLKKYDCSEIVLSLQKLGTYIRGNGNDFGEKAKEVFIWIQETVRFYARKIIETVFGSVDQIKKVIATVAAMPNQAKKTALSVLPKQIKDAIGTTPEKINERLAILDKVVNSEEPSQPLQAIFPKLVVANSSDTYKQMKDKIKNSSMASALKNYFEKLLDNDFDKKYPGKKNDEEKLGDSLANTINKEIESKKIKN